MKAGQLRDLVDIERPVVARNDIGDKIETWMLVETVYARIEPLRGREFLSLREMQSDITTRITIRFLTGLDTTMRIKVGEQAYQIDSMVDVDNRHRAIECLCVAATVAS